MGCKGSKVRILSHRPRDSLKAFKERFLKAFFIGKSTTSTIATNWDALTDQYIVNLPGFGKIIRLTDKAKFEEGRTAFEALVRKGLDNLRVIPWTPQPATK